MRAIQLRELMTIAIRVRPPVVLGDGRRYVAFQDGTFESPLGLSGTVLEGGVDWQLVRPDGAGDEAIRAIEAELKLRDQAAQAGDTAGLRARLEADPNDHQARYDLALALDAQSDRDGALDQLLESVKRDRKWNEEAARKHLVTLFEAMGPTDPRTIAARRRLSTILFS